MGLLTRIPALVLIASLGVVGASPARAATPIDPSDCSAANTWPVAPEDMRGVTLVGRVVPDRFGALRLRVERLFDGRAPLEVRILRTCLEREFHPGERLLVSASSQVIDGQGGEPADLRLWLTDDGGAIWRVGDTGRLQLATDENRGVPPTWLAQLGFTEDVVRAVLADRAPGPEAYRPDPSLNLPSLAAPVPVGPAWSAAAIPEVPGTLTTIVPWKGGLVGFGHPPSDDDWHKPWLLWVSEDGRSWQLVPNALPALDREVTEIRAVAYRDEILLVASVRLHLAVWESSDGRSWRRVPDIPAFRPPHPESVTADSEWQLDLGTLAVHGGRLRIAGGWRYAVCGNDCPGTTWKRVWISDDGEHWRARRSWAGQPEAYMPDSAHVVATADGFVGLRDARHARGQAIEQCSPAMDLWSSPDGLRWRRTDPVGVLCVDAEVTLAADPASRVLYAHLNRGTGSQLLRSVDGGPWQELEPPFPAHWYGKLVVRGSVVLLAGDTTVGDEDFRGVAIWSTDGGTTWTTSTGWPPMMDPLSAAAIGDDRMVVGVRGPTGVMVLDLPSGS